MRAAQSRWELLLRELVLAAFLGLMRWPQVCEWCGTFGANLPGCSCLVSVLSTTPHYMWCVFFAIFVFILIRNIGTVSGYLLVYCKFWLKGARYEVTLRELHRNYRERKTWELCRSTVCSRIFNYMTSEQGRREGAIGRIIYCEVSFWCSNWLWMGSHTFTFQLQTGSGGSRGSILFAKFGVDKIAM